MSSGLRKRGLGEDPSTVENEKVKVRKEDEQGQDIAPDSELRFLYKEDFTELRRLIKEHVGKSNRAEFKELLDKMGSEDRLVMKLKNQRENSNHESGDVDMQHQEKLQPAQDQEGDDDTQSMHSELIEDPEDLSDLSDYTADGELREKDNEAPESNDELENSDNEGSEGPEEEPDDYSNMDSDDDDMETDNEERDTMVSEDEESLEREMSDEEIQRRYGRLSHGELIRNFLAQKELRHYMRIALKKKKENYLTRFVVEANKPVVFAVSKYEFGGRDDKTYEINLDPRGDCGRILKLINFMSEVYIFSFAKVKFGTLDLIGPLPFKRFFKNTKFFYFGNSKMITKCCSFSDLTMNNPELAPLLDFVCGLSHLSVAFPSHFLFNGDKKRVTGGYLTLRGDEVDDVDKIMECHTRTGSIKLAPNSSWSDESVHKVLSAFIEKETDFFGPEEIICHYAHCRNVKPHQRTITQWRKVFRDWRSSYKKLSTYWIDRHIRMTNDV